jgi:hypothetical protein
MSYRLARMCQLISRSCFLIVESSDVSGSTYN